MVVVKRAAACLATVCALSGPALAQEGLGFGLGASMDQDGFQVGSSLGAGGIRWERDRTGRWSMSVARTQWVETRLPLFPKNLVEGNLRPRESYATTFIVSRPLGTLDIAPGAWWGLSGIGVEAEGTLSLHDGLQDHAETTLGVMLRSPKADVAGLGEVGVGWANGFSYAFSDPAFERGASGARGVDSERLQYYMGFEATFTPAVAPNIEIFGRLHHRSGIYGVISPDDTGSNMLGGGVRLNF